MSKKTVSRRAAMKRALVVVGAAAAAPLLKACGGEEALTCTDTAGLPPAAASMRTSNAYVDASTNPEQNCLNCQFYTAAAAGQCGGCTVLQGPIHPEGYCNLWAATAS